MNLIIKPITPDGMAGFDEFNQLNVQWKDEGDFISARIIRDVRSMRCPICNRGWENTAESLRDQHEIYCTRKMAHRSCVRGCIAFKEASFWYNVCTKFNLKGLSFTEIENQYGGAWNNPWYRIVYADLIPKIEVGTRKRVYQITVTEIDEQTSQHLHRLFHKEDVTMAPSRSSFLIHAWDETKAEEYFGEIMKAIRAVDAFQKPIEPCPQT